MRARGSSNGRSLGDCWVATWHALSREHSQKLKLKCPCTWLLLWLPSSRCTGQLICSQLWQTWEKLLFLSQRRFWATSRKLHLKCSPKRTAQWYISSTKFSVKYYLCTKLCILFIWLRSSSSVYEWIMDLSRLVLSPFMDWHVVAVVKSWEGGGSLSELCTAVQSHTAGLERSVVLWRLVPSSRGGVEAIGAVFPAAHHSGLKGEKRVRITRKQHWEHQGNSPSSRSPAVAKTLHIWEAVWPNTSPREKQLRNQSFRLRLHNVRFQDKADCYLYGPDSIFKRLEGCRIPWRMGRREKKTKIKTS